MITPHVTIVIAAGMLDKCSRMVTSKAIGDIEFALGNVLSNAVVSVNLGSLKIADEIVLRMLARMPRAENVTIWSSSNWQPMLEATQRLDQLRAPLGEVT
jgi:hypothetical protein